MLMSIQSVLAKSSKVARRQFTAARKKNLADIAALNWRNEAVRRSLHKSAAKRMPTTRGVRGYATPEKKRVW